MPSQNDLTAPFDPTAYTTLSGAQLLQLVSGLAPYADKGLVVTTIDSAVGVPVVPDANATPKWQGYVWRRIGFTPGDNNIYFYGWNPHISAGAMNQWQSLTLTGIPIGVITNQMLAGSITADKIASVNWAALSAGTIPAATGAVIGTYPNLGPIQPGYITNGMMADEQLTQTKLASGAIDLTDTRTVVGSNQGTVPQCDASTYVHWSPSTQLGRILNVTTLDTLLPSSSTAVVAAVGTNPLYSSTSEVLALAVTRVATALSITNGLIQGGTMPDTSKLLIEVTAQVASRALCYVGLYNSNGAVPSIAGAAMGLAASGLDATARLQEVKFSYTTGAGVGPATYRVCIFGTTVSGAAVPCFLNSLDGATYLFGVAGPNANVSVIKSSIKVTEYI